MQSSENIYRVSHAWLEQQHSHRFGIEWLVLQDAEAGVHPGTKTRSRVSSLETSSLIHGDACLHKSNMSNLEY